MSESPKNQVADSIIRLAGRLEKVPEVQKHDTAGEKEAWTIAHSFVDLDESFQKFSTELLPKLLKDDIDKAELLNTLHEVGEEFRHILYHIHDLKYYKYLFPVD